MIEHAAVAAVVALWVIAIAYLYFTREAPR